MRYNSSKIIKEATEVISDIELQLIKQSGYKLGDENIKIDHSKQNKIDKLNNLMYYTCYLEKQNDEFYNKFTDLIQEIKTLKYIIEDMRQKQNVENKLKDF